MRTVSLDATRTASSNGFARRNGVNDLAADLIRAGYIYDDHYLEMKHLDPKWMVALYVYATALRRALGLRPQPVSRLDRE